MQGEEESNLQSQPGVEMENAVFCIFQFLFETGWEEGDQTGKFGSPCLGKASVSPRTALPIWTFLLV